MQEQRQRSDMQPCIRGRAGGTSVHTKWPCRLGYQTQDIADTAPDRLVHVIMQWGTIFVQIVVIYGFTGGNSWHKSATNKLFEKAIAMTEAINRPAIFLGDFNMDVSKLEMFDTLSSRGFKSLQDLHEAMYQSPMPFTCKGATTPDTAIIHPFLLSSLVAISVDQQGLFDAHAPVILRFQVPEGNLFQTRLRMPKTWTQLPIEADDIAQAAMQTCANAEPATLHEWAQLVEHTVSHAITTDHNHNPQLQPLPCLPKRFCGRCRPPKFLLQVICQSSLCLLRKPQEAPGQKKLRNRLPRTA